MSTHWDRRKSKNRRKTDEDKKYPFRDSQGNLVTCDRRLRDDRRTGIEVSQEIISEEEFEKFLQRSAKNKIS